MFKMPAPRNQGKEDVLTFIEHFVWYVPSIWVFSWIAHKNPIRFVSHFYTFG